LIFVLDASITAAWALPDESSALADNLLSMAQVDGAIVPSLWWYEIRNILLIAERRNRIASTDADAFMRSLARMAISIGELGDGAAVLRLARLHRLSVYDAAYLEIAMRGSLPLATLDRDLARAARQESVVVLDI